ncbi:unnamed protein product [Caenorhabditis brenneri]
MRMLFGFICFGVIGSNEGSADSLCDITNLPVHCDFPAWDYPDLPMGMSFFPNGWPALDYPTTLGTPELKSTTKTSTSTATIISSTTTVPDTRTQPLQISTVTTSSTTVPPIAFSLSEGPATSSSSVVKTIMAVKEGMAHPLAVYGICGIVLACSVYLYVKSKKQFKQVQIELTLLNERNVIIKVV